MKSWSANNSSTSPALWHERLPGRREQKSRAVRRVGPRPRASSAAPTAAYVSAMAGCTNAGIPNIGDEATSRSTRVGLGGDHDPRGFDAGGPEQVPLPAPPGSSPGGAKTSARRSGCRSKARGPAPQMGHLLGERMPEVAAHIAVEVVAGPSRRAAGRSGSRTKRGAHSANATLRSRRLKWCR